MEKTQVAIIGAGVVGLAIAARLSEKFDDLLVLERHESFGRETSSRNSEVIHASVYYPRDFLKGRLCLRGNDLTYEICRANDIPHQNCGKLIVACDERDLQALPALYETAKNNGAKGVRIVEKAEIARIEPKVQAEAALYCPSSGVVDSHSLMRHFEAVAISLGANVAYGNEVVEIEKISGGFRVGARSNDGEISRFETEILINSAGLSSGNIAELAGIDVDEAGYRINYHKGIYYRVDKKLDKYPRTLIYPVPPEEGSVGVHTCPDTAGGMRLGPHFIWSDALDYSVDDTFGDYFFEAARRYLPFLEREDISPDSAGFMSAVQSPGEPMRDFIIQNEDERGLPGLINLIGIESPGLTSAPAIAEYIENIV